MGKELSLMEFCRKIELPDSAIIELLESTNNEIFEKLFNTWGMLRDQPEEDWDWKRLADLQAQILMRLWI